MFRRIAASELAAFIEQSGVAFPAIDYVWQTLRCRGRLLGEGSFCWGMLPLTVCEAAGGDPLRAMPLAIAVDCLITALDTLDDVEDQDSPSALWQTAGIPTAINVATYLFFLAQLSVSALAERGVPPEKAIVVSEVLASAGARACGGQQIDLDQTSLPGFSESQYLDMISRKSAGLVEAVCRAGALLGVAPDEDVELLAQFGHNLGMAMQIANDLTGVTTERAERNDLSARKRTLPIIYALERAPEPMRGHLQAIYEADGRNPLGADECERVVRILEWSGAGQYAAVIADVYWERALLRLEKLSRARAEPLRDLSNTLRDSVAN